MRHIYQNDVQDGFGNAVANATVTVYLAGTSDLATIYTQAVGGSADADSQVSTDSQGLFFFYIDDSDYMPTQKFKYTVTYTGYTGETYDNVVIIPWAANTYYVDATATNQGAATSEADRSLFDLLATIGSDQAVVKLTNSSGSATTDYVWGTSDTVPSNVYLDIDPGALIKPANSITLTVNSPEHIKASPKQKIVDLTNNSTNPLMFTNGGVVSPCWYGAVGDCTAVDTGTDDATAFQAAANAVDNINFCTFETPHGMRFRIGSTVTFNWGGGHGGKVILNSPITPDAAADNFIELLDGRYNEFKLYVYEGGQTATYSSADPAGNSQAFLIRGIRDAQISVDAHNFLGRVLRVSEESGGEEKTSKLNFPHIHTGTSGTGCGQALYVDCTSAWGSIIDFKDFYSEYGPIFYETDDVYIGHLDGGFTTSTDSGFIVEGCRSFWADTLSLGDVTSHTVDLFTFKASSTPTYCSNIHINKIFALNGTKGVVLDDVGEDTGNSSVSIDCIKVKSNSEHGVYINNCRGLRIGVVDSVEEEVAIEFGTTASFNIDIGLNLLDTQKQALIVGANNYDLRFTGRIKNANASSTASTSAIDVSSTEAGIYFTDVVINSGEVDFGYDLVASNQVVIQGGEIAITGGGSAMDDNPKVARNIKGFLTENIVSTSITSGNSSVTGVSHGLAVDPEIILPIGFHTEVGSLYINYTATSSTFDIYTNDGPAGGTRAIYVYLAALISQPD